LAGVSTASIRGRTSSQHSAAHALQAYGDEKMTDSLYLLFAALICAGCAWALWHFLGADMLYVLLILSFLGVCGDNIRLRRKLREKSLPLK
jgi:hypothetical protein